MYIYQSFIFGYSLTLLLPSFLFSLYQHKEKEKRSKEKRKAERLTCCRFTASYWKVM